MAISCCCTREAIRGLRPAMLMVMVQASFAGVNVLVKLAVNHGMSIKVFIAYRFMFATGFILPVALLAERKSRPKLTPMIVWQGFLCGLFGGTLVQIPYMECLVLTSPTFASAMGNLVPAATFILALIFRLEKLGLKTLPGKMKIIGTVVGIGGAMTLTFYKGVDLKLWDTHMDLMKIVGTEDSTSPLTPKSVNPVMGAIMGGLSCISFGIWLIIQTKLNVRYPCQYSCTALLSFMAAVQTTVFALCVERNWSRWKLEFNIRLLTVIYSGAVVSGMMISVMAWCVRMRGPLFVSVFNPLMLVLVALASSLLLQEKLTLGCVLGGVLIISGVYTVLWGKGQEMKRLTSTSPTAEEDQKDQKSTTIAICDDPSEQEKSMNSTKKIADGGLKEDV
uniref:WAT1-related protein n=1 Tax=Kalanchoe fedtschenkoi TaxID=63787 RepID=A0A7N1A6R2_KALFE